MEYLQFADKLCQIVRRAEQCNQDRDTILTELLGQAEEYREMFYKLEEMMGAA